MTKPKLVAKTAIFDPDGKILILRRSQTDKIRPGQFDLPGGGLEPGESPTEAVLREMVEEIGLKLGPNDITLSYSSTEYYDDISRVRFLFVAYLDHQPEIVLSFEHDRYEWMTFDDALEKYDHPTWIGGLRYLRDHNLL